MTRPESGIVVGCGSIGQRHIRNIRALDVPEVIGVDTNRQSREAAMDVGATETYADLGDALSTRSPQFGIVAVPNSLHIPIARKLAAAGVALFIEKPLSQSNEGTATLSEDVEAADLVTLVGCNLRFHPEIRKIHELLQDGAIGPVVAARIEGGSYLPEWHPDSDYRDSYSARAALGGGVILDYIHEINYARWFFGEFESVSAMAGHRSNLEIETNDVAGILAETRDGVLCEFHLDYIQRPYSRSAHIIGENGTIRWSWNDEQVRWYVAETDEWSTYDRPASWETNDMYVDELEHFLSCVQSGATTICPVNCGRNDLAVALAAQESATTGAHVTPGTF